jgi:hypothetical protein
VRWERRPGGEARPEDLLKRFSARVQQLTERVRAAVRAAVPEATEEVRPAGGYFGYRVRHHFASVAPQEDHVRIGFPHGALVDDPNGLLGTDAHRSVRYLRIDRPADARSAVLATLLRKAADCVPPRRPPRGRVQLLRLQRRSQRGNAAR